MAGIYIHIPFCRRKCHYCNFFSLATVKFRDSFLQALKKEINLTRDYLSGEPVQTIYLGGGTPSVYLPQMIDPVNLGILSTGNQEAKDHEITLEINPEDVTADYIRALRATSFNRFSLGIQSFDDGGLKFMNRGHDGRQAMKSVRMLQESGMENLSIDLIYGVQGFDDENWRKNLEIAFSLDVPHLSAYALTVEEGTPLHWMTNRGKAQPVDEEAQVSQFRLLMKMAADHGYEHYEISNFAKPGRYALHNTNYWRGEKYLGLGPSAHSYNGDARRWNVSNLTRYLAALESDDLPFEEEILTPVQQFNEYVMISLRTQWGCDTGWVARRFGEEFARELLRQAAGFEVNGHLKINNGIIRLTDEGKLLADGITAQIFSA